MTRSPKINELEDRITCDIIYRIEKSEEKIRLLADRLSYDVIYQIEELQKVIGRLEKRLSANETENTELKTQNVLLSKIVRSISGNSDSEIMSTENESKDIGSEYW